MKKFTFIIFTFCATTLFAQNYQNICSPGVTFYKDSNDVLKAFRPDSLYLPGNSDSIFISYRTIRDTTGQDYGTCYDTANGSVLGRKVYKKSNGMFYFFNRNNDSVRILSTATLIQTWRFCDLPGNHYIQAKVTSIISDSVADTIDLVKVITLQAKDNSNNNVSHILNGKTIKLSQHYGLSKMLDVLFIPEDTTPYLLAGKSFQHIGLQDITWKDVFDYNIGDVFHYETLYGWNMTAHEYSIYTVLDKVVQGNFNLVTYTMDHCRILYSYPGIYKGHDTLTFSYDSSNTAGMYILTLPEEFGPETYYYGFRNRFSADAADYNHRLTKATEEGYYKKIPGDTCWTYGLFETYSESKYTRGLGCTYSIYSDAGNFDQTIQSLVYFKKGNETWGDPVSTDCNTLLGTVNKISPEKVRLIIAPNPVESQAMITMNGMDKYTFGTYVLNDISGRELAREKITSNPFTFDRSGLAAGIYILSVANKQGMIVSRVKLIIR